MDRISPQVHAVSKRTMGKFLPSNEPVGEAMRIDSDISTQEVEEADQKQEGEKPTEDVGTDGRSSARAIVQQPLPAREVNGEVGHKNGDDGHQLETEELTPRQLEILTLYRREKSVTNIGRLLGIGTKTVSSHLAVIRDKRGLSDIRELLDDYEAPSEGVVTAAKLLKLIEDQDYRCALSGRKLEPDTSTLDHKVPRSAGGEHTMDNVWFLHRDVNRAKGTQAVDEFLRMCRQVCQYFEGDAP